MTCSDRLKEARELRAAGKLDEATRVIQDALRREQFSAEDVEKAGRMLERLWEAMPGCDSRPKVLCLGQCTTAWFATCLRAKAWANGLALQVDDGPYDNVLQHLLAIRAAGDKPEVVVLAPWNQRLLSASGERTQQQRIAEEISFWKQAWQVAAQMGTRIVQMSFDWMQAGALGFHLSGVDGDIDTIRSANAALRAELPGGAYFLDLEAVSSTMGRETFYSARRYFWTKQPFSEEGTVRLADHLAAGIGALLIGPKKVLVLDLDNTLWGGVVGETGPLGIDLGDSPTGEAHRALQKYTQQLAKRGCLLAVCSKNNAADAREPFEKNPDMVLRLEDFAAFEASWDPKAVAIERIARQLRLGTDSFVFLDDNSVEREHVRQALPDVAVVEVSEDPAEYVGALERGLYFESVRLTAEDRERQEQYRIERERAGQQVAFATTEDYLRSLEMVGAIAPVDDTNLPRVAQLLGKTNQFNLTTRRHSAKDVQSLLTHPRSVGLTFSMADRFGDHGLIALVLGMPEGHELSETLRIDTWLMSCRVIGRTTEEFIFNAVRAAAQRLNYTTILGEYIPTSKNELVSRLYDRLGFPGASMSDRSKMYFGMIEALPEAVTFVMEVQAACQAA